VKGVKLTGPISSKITKIVFVIVIVINN
jgi:hypothetical protein